MKVHQLSKIHLTILKNSKPLTEEYLAILKFHGMLVAKIEQKRSLEVGEMFVFELIGAKIV
jgi:hypothetical protein